MNKKIKYIIKGFCLIFFFSHCGNKTNLDLLYYDKTVKLSEIFNSKNFIIEERRGVNAFQSIYLTKRKFDGKKIVFYLDRFKSLDTSYLLIKDKILLRKLDSTQYIQTGTFEDKNGQHLSVIAIEKHTHIEMPDPSIEIFDLWILNREKEKFIKKNEKKYLRIHEAYYLKSDTASWSSYEDYEKLKKRL